MCSSMSITRVDIYKKNTKSYEPSLQYSMPGNASIHCILYFTRVYYNSVIRAGTGKVLSCFLRNSNFYFTYWYRRFDCDVDKIHRPIRGCVCIDTNATIKKRQAIWYCAQYEDSVFITNNAPIK